MATLATSDLVLNVHGFAAVNRDLQVELRDPVTDRVVKTVKPFSDGTARMSKVPAGAYQVLLRHPNLIEPVLRRPIRILPTPETRVSVLIDPSRFRNTPIEDIPEANLAPVTDLASSVAETVAPLAGKQPGEAIRSDDWNAMAGGIRDLALAVAELSRVVSPVGHDHPEFISKFGEVTGNFQSLLESLSSAFTELQRQIQARRFRQQVEDVLLEAGIDKGSTEGRGYLSLVEDLEVATTATPTEFGRKARTVGVQLGSKLEQLVDAQGADFATNDKVREATRAIDDIKAIESKTFANELEHHRLADRKFGAGYLKTISK